MKFSVINTRPNEPIHTTMTCASPPLGILYIASSLERTGIEVTALDQTSETSSVEKVVDWIIKEDPDILGISVLINSSLIAPRIAEEVKKENPSITVVMGNHHATNNAERILEKYPYVDIIVRGEGEETCLDLAQCIEKQRSLKDTLGITYRHGGKIISNPDRPLIKDINSIPFPDRDLLDVGYHNTVMGIKVAPKKFTSFLSSRGCVFKCSFCSCGSIAHSVWRHRSIENIMEELHFLACEGYQQLMFVDDNFTLNQKRVIELCQRMRKEGIDMEWICEGRVDQSSDTLFKEMVKAGCRMLYFGIESANQNVLDYLNKGITPDQSLKAVEKAHKAGVDIIVGSFIIGAPFETKDNVQETLDFTTKLKIDIPQINLLQANPGTPLWEEYKNKGLLDEGESWEHGVFISDISPNTVPRQELLHMIDNYYQEYLGNPRYILKQMMLTAKSSYRRNIVTSNLNQIGAIRNMVRNLPSDKYTLS